LESQIRLVISEAMRKKLSDPRLELMASITRVEITADLSYADVNFSIMGTDSQQRAFMRAMDRAHGILQGLVAKNLRTRTCPTLRFHLDQSLKRGFETMQVIEKSKAARAEREGGRSAESAPESENPDSDKSENTQE